MSKANRLKVYDRLVSLGRELDISQALKDEFGKKEEPVVKKKVKKNAV